MTERLRRDIFTEIPALERAAEYFFRAGAEGKRLRSTMLLLMASALAPAPAGLDHLTVDTSPPAEHPPTVRRRQQRIAEITELIHVASLLHDDVIDAAGTRRGKKSLNALFGNKVPAGLCVCACARVCACAFGRGCGAAAAAWLRCLPSVARQAARPPCPPLLAAARPAWRRGVALLALMVPLALIALPVPPVPQVAILAGDFLLARASVSLAALRNPEAILLMSQSLEHLVAGEILQVGVWGV